MLNNRIYIRKKYAGLRKPQEEPGQFAGIRT